jgi:hypothetical protein
MRINKERRERMIAAAYARGEFAECGTKTQQVMESIHKKHINELHEAIHQQDPLEAIERRCLLFALSKISRIFSILRKAKNFWRRRIKPLKNSIALY